MAHYEIWLSDPFGNRLALLDNFISMSLARVNNGLGSVTIIMPDGFDKTKAVKDGRIEVWRDAGRGLRLVTDTIFFARRFTRQLSADGSKTFTITGYSPLYLLTNPSGNAGRFVDADAGSANGKKTGALDDIMKQVLRDSIGSGAVAARDLSSYVTIEANTAQGAAAQTKEFARRNVGRVLKELHRQSHTNTPIIYWDFVSDNPTSIRFRTYPNLRGQDVTSAVIFSPEMGNIASYKLDVDYTDEVTAVTAGGRGVKGDRDTAEVVSSRATETLYGRREAFVNAGHFDSSTGLSGEASQAVYDGRPEIKLEAELVDTPQARFMLDWNYGDKITVSVEGYNFQAPIDAIGLRVAGGVETISAYIRVTTT